MGGDLVIYFSLSGETERVANIIASNYNATTIRVGTEDAGKRLLLARYFLRKLLNKPIVTIPKIYFPDYEKVYIGCPIWADSPAAPMTYFLKNTKLTEVELVPFVTHKTDSPHKALETLANLVRKQGGTVLSTHAFKKGIPKDMILGELEGKQFRPEKTGDVDLGKFKN